MPYNAIGNHRLVVYDEDDDDFHLDILCPVPLQYNVLVIVPPPPMVVWAPGIEPYPFEAFARYGEKELCHPWFVVDEEGDPIPLLKQRRTSHLRVSPCTMMMCECVLLHNKRPRRMTHGYDRCERLMPSDCWIQYEVNMVSVEDMLPANEPPSFVQADEQYPVEMLTEGHGEDFVTWLNVDWQNPVPESERWPA